MMQISIKTPLEHFNLDVDLTLPSRGISVLFGPSGCGKTTILRCIAGLHKAQNAHIEFAKQVWQSSAIFEKTHRREIGYVFQDPCLFPHLSVKQNLCFGLERQPIPIESAPIQWNEIVQLLGLTHLLSRMPKHLSGGEKQRVAIGRALLTQPKVLLMDEPLSALDQNSKSDIIPYIENISKRLAIPIIYVTHAQTEVESLADYIVLLEKGAVVAQGGIKSMMQDLSSPLSHLNDAGALVDAQVVDYDEAYDLTELKITPNQSLSIPGKIGDLNSVKRIKIAANHISLSRTLANDSTIINRLPATIIEIDIESVSQCIVRLRLDEQVELLARITCRSRDQLALTPGEQIYAQIKGVSLVKR